MVCLFFNFTFKIFTWGGKNKPIFWTLLQSHSKAHFPQLPFCFPRSSGALSALPLWSHFSTFSATKSLLGTKCCRSSLLPLVCCQLLEFWFCVVLLFVWWEGKHSQMKRFKQPRCKKTDEDLQKPIPLPLTDTHWKCIIKLENALYSSCVFHRNSPFPEASVSLQQFFAALLSMEMIMWSCIV